MPEALILTPLLLAAVLAASGVAKLRDAGSGRAAFDALRVPPALAQPWIVAAVPYAELALAVGLLLTQGWVLAIVMAEASDATAMIPCRWAKAKDIAPVTVATSTLSGSRRR